MSFVLSLGLFSVFANLHTEHALVDLVPLGPRVVRVDQHNIELEALAVIVGNFFVRWSPISKLKHALFQSSGRPPATLCLANNPELG